MENLRKFIVVAVLLCLSVGASAQKGDISILGKLGYQSDFKRFGIEVGGRYGIIPNLRVAPAVSFWIPKNDCLGFNVDLNAQYTFAIPQTTIDVYPLAGLNMSNNSLDIKGFDGFEGLEGWDEIKVEGKNYKWTDWGFNLGFGADYYLTKDDYLNVEFKYTFGNHDFATIMVGYGYKF